MEAANVNENGCGQGLKWWFLTELAWPGFNTEDGLRQAQTHTKCANNYFYTMNLFTAK